MKKGPFKLKSGNKPSMAQLSGVSPVKLSQFQKDVQARKARKKAELKAKREEAKTSGKPKEPSRLQKNISNVFSSIDKGVQRFFNNTRGKQRTGENKYVPQKKGTASDSPTPPPNNSYKKIKGESRYSYKKNTTTGGYDFIDHQNNDKKGTIKATNKKAMDHLNSAFPMKKSPAKKKQKKK